MERIYARHIKRILDLVCALIALIIFSPLLTVLTAVGAAVLKGNPFFVQVRPGKNEKLFRLVKFRTMTDEKDRNGILLCDEKRLVPYGRFLRITSLDELPELFNILRGDMSIVGPRPLLKEYLPYYSESERHRHDVRPGLTGLAQINGRNGISFEERFKYDLQYVENISLTGDIRILLGTVMKVLKREGITHGTAATMERLDECRKRN